MSTESIMIASHQIRMQKFIKDLASKANIPYTEKKINNCSIIKIELRTNGSSNIQMVYWGGNEDLSEYTINACGCYPPPNPSPKDKFYSKNDNLEFNFNTDLLIDLDSLPKDLDVYIIRHGQGTHNIRNYADKIIAQIPGFDIDTKLTNDGKQQAINAGKIMDNCLRQRVTPDYYDSLDNIQKVYSSDLKRTQQTLIKFFEGFGEDIPNNEITVIPGAHEIVGDWPIYTDDSIPGILPVATENTTSYTIDQGDTTIVNGVKILWNRYLNFYGGYTRNHITCNDSSKFKDNFVSKAVIDYFSQYDVQLPDVPDNNPDEPVYLPDVPDNNPDESVYLPDVPVSHGLDESTELRGGGKKSKIKTHKKPKKVKVTYKNKTKIIPKKYIAGLKGKERKAQIKSIFENTDRPKTSFKEKRSQWIIKFEKKYNQKITDKSWIHKNIITNTGQNKILSKGRGAYYSSGSRPNQTPDSWAYARLASVIMNGPSRKYDMKIWNKYKV